MRSLSLLEPWHMFLRFIQPDDDPTWPFQELSKDVCFVGASWCKYHKRWCGPRECARCLMTEWEVGVRLEYGEVRRVLPVDELTVRTAITAVSSQIDSWLRRAWRSVFFNNDVSKDARVSARLLRRVRDIPHLLEVADTSDPGFETWSLPEENGGTWEEHVARAHALNRVLNRLGRGLHDSTWAFAAQRAAQVAWRFGEQGSHLYPYIAGCLDTILDCVLVIQMRTVELGLITKRVNAAGAGFLWSGQDLMLPQASGAVCLVPSDRAFHWIDSTIYTPTGRSPSRVNFQTLYPNDKFSVIRGRPSSDPVLYHLKDMPLRFDPLDPEPKTDSDLSHIEALISSYQHLARKARETTRDTRPNRIGVGSPDELRRAQRGMGKRF